METRRKRQLYNIVMTVLAVVIVLSALMTVGSIKGWFDNRDDAILIVDGVTGVTSVKRSEVEYSLDSGTVIRDKDLLSATRDSSITLSSVSDEYILSENTESLIIIADDAISLDIKRGEIFVVTSEDSKLGSIIINDRALTLGTGVYSISVRQGTSSIYAYEGEATIAASGTKIIAGQVIDIVESVESTTEAKISDLDNFILENLGRISSNRSICFSAKDIDAVLKDRQTQVSLALGEEGDRIVLGDGNSSVDSANADDSSGNSNVSVDGSKSNSEGAVSSTGIDSSARRDSESNDASSTTATNGSNTSSGVKNSSDSGTEVSKTVKTCTIEIRCDEILSNMGNLTAGKEGYVPSSGTILATSTVEFNDGDTAFDILKRACDAAGIQLEYSWSPAYSTNYVEGINHLYQFDCGDMSGWMYKVNGWYPNYGASAYNMKDKDVMVWTYVCGY